MVAYKVDSGSEPIAYRLTGAPSRLPRTDRTLRFSPKNVPPPLPRLERRRLIPIAPLPFSGAPYIPPSHDSVAMARALSSRPPPFAPPQASASHATHEREHGIFHQLAKATKPLVVSWSLVGALAFAMHYDANIADPLAETLVLQPVRIQVAQSEPLEALSPRTQAPTADRGVDGAEPSEITQDEAEPLAALLDAALSDANPAPRPSARRTGAAARPRQPRQTEAAAEASVETNTVEPSVAVAPIIAVRPTTGEVAPRTTSMRRPRRRAATQMMPAPMRRAPETNLPETPSRAQVRAGLQSVRGAVRSCAPGASGSVRVRVSIAGSGRVTTALVQDERWARPPYGSCIARAIRTATFPRFEKDRLVVVYPFRF